jgi:hypothetical protein
VRSSEDRELLDKAILAALPKAGGKVRSLLESLQAELAKVDEKRKPCWGDRVRTACAATGRYLGEFEGRHLALFVSAMDSSLCVDLVDEKGDPPSGKLPVPTDCEIEAAHFGIQYGLRIGATRPDPSGGGSR